MIHQKDFNGNSLLIDLENAGKEGPVDYRIVGWPMLADGVEYTKEVDMAMVGQLVGQCGAILDLTEHGRDCAKHMTSLSATEAIEHPWLGGVL